MTIATGLPEGWQCRMSNSKKQPYYLFVESKLSQWEPPEGTDVEMLHAFLRKLGWDINEVRASHILVKHCKSRRPSSWREVKFELVLEERGYIN